MNILFVCTGNTCRSPMAEVLARAAFSKKGCHVEVCSAGVAAAPGDPASNHAMAVMKAMGLDLSVHRSRQVTQEVLNGADLILAMTHGHKARLQAMGILCTDKLFTLHEYVNDGLKDVADPYLQSLDVYKRCACEINEAILKLTECIK